MAAKTCLAEFLSTLRGSGSSNVIVMKFRQSTPNYKGATQRIV
jgi:hypothetical protein